MAAPPTRVDEDLYESARAFGKLMSRSAAQQLAHWARIGRELEATRALSHEEVTSVLMGEGSYDALAPEQQAIVRAEWGEQIAQRRKALNMASELGRELRSYAEVDDDGNVVRVDPGSKPKVVARRSAAERKPRAKRPAQ